MILRILGVLVVSALLLAATGDGAQADVRPPAATTNATDTIRPSLPSNLKSTPAADNWRAIKDGTTGTVSIPDEKAGRLIQTSGMEWLEFRREVIGFWGTIALAGMIALLTAFFMIRGRIRIESGRSGQLIQRFKLYEVIGHWMAAVSFLLLALTGLNILYGRQVLLPVLGTEAFAGATLAGKYIHNYLGFVFMASLLYLFVIWVRHNIWDRYDFNWILKGGGLLTKHSHPPADKFNFGQKTVFWMVILLGLGLSVSGLSLMMPFWFDFNASIERMQTIQLVHSGLGVGLFVLMLAHIYIGSIGMESAFDAMKTGWVDLNWAKEHHSAWVERYLKREDGHARPPTRPPEGSRSPETRPAE